ncbi:MAG: hypothetical protein HYR98_01120 [Nitrospirae bacterium]|nr:hypothetical protein [Nitrospirota bacterium]
MVIETVSRPEQVVMGYAGRPVVHRRYETGSRVKLLRVVYEEASDRRIVVTAYLTSDVERYWKEKGR